MSERVPVPVPIAPPNLMKGIIDKIGERRDEAFARKKKLIPYLFIVMSLLLICICLPKDVVLFPLIPSMWAMFLVIKALDVETAKIHAYHRAIDDIINGWQLDMDSILALMSTMMPSVEPDREINNE